MIGEKCADARIPLAGLVDLRVRRVDIASEACRTLWADMIRLKAEDFERSEPRRALAAAGSLSEEAFATRFGSLADRATPAATVRAARGLYKSRRARDPLPGYPVLSRHRGR